jgi:hypothetical protein
VILYRVSPYCSETIEEGGDDDVWCTSLRAARDVARECVPSKDPAVVEDEDGNPQGGGIYEAKISRVDVITERGRAGVCALLNQRSFVRDSTIVETWTLRFGGKRTITIGSEPTPCELAAAKMVKGGVS